MAFTVQSMVEWQPPHPLLVNFEHFPYPRGIYYRSRFCIKMTAKDAPTAIKNRFV